jgi:hypothetical protein
MSGELNMTSSGLKDGASNPNITVEPLTPSSAVSCLLEVVGAIVAAAATAAAAFEVLVILVLLSSEEPNLDCKLAVEN